MIFDESGMEFQFSEADFNVWLPEQCDDYIKMEGVKMADFMVEVKQTKVFLVEVKTSAPKDTQEFLSEIATKLRSMLSLFTSITWGRKNDTGAELPKAWKKKAFLKNEKWRCLLIVKDHKDEWLHGLQDSITIHPDFKELVQLYGLLPPICLNEKKVESFGWLKT